VCGQWESREGGRVRAACPCAGLFPGEGKQEKACHCGIFCCCASALQPLLCPCTPAVSLPTAGTSSRAPTARFACWARPCCTRCRPTWVSHSCAGTAAAGWQACFATAEWRLVGAGCTIRPISFDHPALPPAVHPSLLPPWLPAAVVRHRMNSSQNWQFVAHRGELLQQGILLKARRRCAHSGHSKGGARAGPAGCGLRYLPGLTAVRHVNRSYWYHLRSFSPVFKEQIFGWQSCLPLPLLLPLPTDRRAHV